MKVRKCECTICRKKYISNRKETFTCGNKKCSDASNYIRHKERYIEGAKKWARNNPEKRKIVAKRSIKKFIKEKPERFNELMRNAYHRNKSKWNSRSMTGNILNGRAGYKKYNPLEKQCKCGSIENLEIHHKTYPNSVKGIKKAMDEGKIYYKCRRCHGRRNGHNI